MFYYNSKVSECVKGKKIVEYKVYVYCYWSVVSFSLFGKGYKRSVVCLGKCRWCLLNFMLTKNENRRDEIKKCSRLFFSRIVRGALKSVVCC